MLEEGHISAQGQHTFLMENSSCYRTLLQHTGEKCATADDGMFRYSFDVFQYIYSIANIINNLSNVNLSICQITSW